MFNTGKNNNQSSRRLCTTPQRFSAAITRHRHERSHKKLRIVVVTTLSVIFLVSATPSNASIVYRSILGAFSSVRVMFNDALKPPPMISAPEEKPLPQASREQIWMAVVSSGQQYQIKPTLIWGIISAASKFDQNAKSPEGAMGLMQLMPDTAEQMGVRRPFDPLENISGGSRYLKMLVDKYDGNLEKALTAYRAGPGGVDKSPTQKTLNFVRSVLSIYQDEEKKRELSKFPQPKPKTSQIDRL